MKSEFGNGYFGKWIEDENGLPAYKYTCNQIKDPKAITPMNDMWRDPTDHIFLVGNDRIVGLASNYGYVMVRQDEGAPKYLNYHDPGLNQYAGGFGYLTDGKSSISTYYNGQNSNFERVFGIGYISKRVSNQNYKVNQTIFAPFGDDPVLISQIEIYNNILQTIDLKWIEYWGCFNFQFSFQAVLDAIKEKKVDPLKNYRIKLEKSYKNKSIVLDNGRGLVNLKYDEKSSKLEEQLNFEERIKGIPIQRKKASFEDKNPPPIFLVSLDDKATAVQNDGSLFFGKGGNQNPDGLNFNGAFNEEISDFNSCLIIERKVKIPPKTSKIIYFAYGYVPEGFELNDLIEKYQDNLPNLFNLSCNKWKENRIKLDMNEDLWIDRELFWNYYYLRGALTYDDYFNEHILSQGHVYQYIIGFQGAARDPLQHALPFLFIEPRIVKEIIRYTLKEIQEDGKIPYGITGNGMIMPSLWDPSDLQLWLIWLISDYILLTRDSDFINEEISMYPVYGRKVQKKTIKDVLFLTYDYFVKVIGKGKHGLLRVTSCDWNDLVITGFVPENKQDEVKKVGESILNTAMAIYVLSQFSEMLSFIGMIEKSDEIREFMVSLIKPLKDHWNGKWFKRAWLSEELGWVGNDMLWLEPQPWALISEILDLPQAETLIKNINELNRKPSPIGAIILSKTIDNQVETAGVATNAGIWPSINGTLIWALSKFSGNLAYDEWKKNTFALKSSIYPDIWYGIWSGPDTWNSSYSEYPGQTLFDKFYLTKNPKDKQEGLLSMGINWTDFPVLNLHPHAWSLYNIFHLIGLRFTKNGIELNPKFPKKEYQIKSPVISFERTLNCYQGSYSPKKEGEYQIKLILPRDEIEAINKIEVNGKKIKATLIEANAIIFKGRKDSLEPISWKVSF